MQELKNIIKELNYQNNDKSIIFIKPSDIDKIEDAIKRKETLYRFNLIYEFFVSPLEKILEFLLKKDLKANQAIYQNNNISIYDKIYFIGMIFEENGYSAKELIEFVPKSMKEIEILLLAKNAGLKASDEILTNEEKIKQSIDYLEKLSNEECIKLKCQS